MPSKTLKRLSPTCINASNKFWDNHKICPACRSYDLEKQWCEACNHTGFVERKALQKP